MNNLGHLHLCIYAFIAYLLHLFISLGRREWLQEKYKVFHPDLGTWVPMNHLFVLAALK